MHEADKACSCCTGDLRLLFFALNFVAMVKEDAVTVL